MTREAFEAWISAPPFERSVARYSLDPAVAAWPGAYRDDQTALAWEAWRTSAENGGKRRVVLDLANARDDLAAAHSALQRIRDFPRDELDANPHAAHHIAAAVLREHARLEVWRKAAAL